MSLQDVAAVIRAAARLGGLAVATASVGFCQTVSFVYSSSMYVDPGSGAIDVWASTYVLTDPYSETVWSRLEATAQNNLSGRVGVFETNNCGWGCAEVRITSQVDNLGTSLRESTYHTGEIMYTGWWIEYWGDTWDYYDVPRLRAPTTTR